MTGDQDKLYQSVVEGMRRMEENLNELLGRNSSMVGGQCRRGCNMVPICMFPLFSCPLSRPGLVPECWVEGTRRMQDNLNELLCLRFPA